MVETVFIIYKFQPGSDSEFVLDLMLSAFLELERRKRVVSVQINTMEPKNPHSLDNLNA